MYISYIYTNILIYRQIFDRYINNYVNIYIYIYITIFLTYLKSNFENCAATKKDDDENASFIQSVCFTCSLTHQLYIIHIIHIFTYTIYENRRANGPAACQISHLVVFVIDSSISLIIGHLPGTPDPLNPCVDIPWATPGCSKDRYRFLIDLGRIKNKNWHRTKTSKFRG